MASFNKFNLFVDALAKKKLDLSGTDTLKVMLTNTAPVATNAVYADVSGTELANGNGYTTGGSAAASPTLSNSSGTEKLVATDVVFTASGAMGPFRYAILYDFTATNKDLIGYWDYGSSITLASGETFTVHFDATNGILQLV